MSWINENYEKAALGAAAFVTLGLSFVGFSKLSSVEDEFGGLPKGLGLSDPAVKNADAVATSKSSFKLKRDWTQADDQGRPVDLFIGVALFVNKNDLENPVDLIKGDAVHDTIPNAWWIQNRIDPGFADSPIRDEDKDGFTNLEEYKAKTNPSDPSKHPELISKLQYVGDDTITWVLRPGFESENGSFTFDFASGKETNKVSPANPVPKGGVFFADGLGKGRFRLLGSEKRMVVNPKFQTETEVNFVKIEDLSENKKGDIYEIPASFPKQKAADFAHYDRSAVFTLEAVGEQAKEFKVSERTTFSLPSSSSEKSFYLKEVTPEYVVVETKSTDGKTMTAKILKGSIGPAIP